MANMDELSTVFFDSEKEYIKRFCEEYKNPIKTPDGFIVSCKYIKETAHHFCYGKINKFQETRAHRILYAKYILLHPEERILLENQKIKDALLFFYLKRRNSYLVVCRVVGEKNLDLVSGYPVFGNKVLDFQEPRFPFKFFQN